MAVVVTTTTTTTTTTVVVATTTTTMMAATTTTLVQKVEKYQQHPTSATSITVGPMVSIRHTTIVNAPIQSLVIKMLPFIPTRWVDGKQTPLDGVGLSQTPESLGGMRRVK